MVADWLKVPRDIAVQSYEIATEPIDGFSKDAKIDMEGFKNVLMLRAEIGGQWGGTAPSPQRYLDLSYHTRAIAGP
jgi:hypothetical protein